jgi:hypothetical protein
VVPAIFRILSSPHGARDYATIYSKNKIHVAVWMALLLLSRGRDAQPARVGWRSTHTLCIGGALARCHRGDERWLDAAALEGRTSVCVSEL